MAMILALDAFVFLANFWFLQWMPVLEFPWLIFVFSHGQFDLTEKFRLIILFELGIIHHPLLMSKFPLHTLDTYTLPALSRFMQSQSSKKKAGGLGRTLTPTVTYIESDLGSFSFHLLTLDAKFQSKYCTCEKTNFIHGNSRSGIHYKN